MDATIIPYKCNEATRNIYPLKLHEYLAAGRPVVSAPLPALEPFADVVALAPDHAAFVACLEEALAQDNDEMRAKRQRVARANSWDVRVQERMAHAARLLEPAASAA